jgi:hypothetical protein
MELGCVRSAISSTQRSSFAFFVGAVSAFAPFVAPVVSFNVD